MEIGRSRREDAARRSRAMRFQRAMLASDRAISRLEELNMRGGGAGVPDTGTRAAIDRAFAAALPTGAKAKTKPWRTVQQALDRLFDLQEVLQAERWREENAKRRLLEGGVRAAPRVAVTGGRPIL